MMSWSSETRVSLAWVLGLAATSGPIAAVSTAAERAEAPERVRDIGSHLELFVDHYLIQRMKGACLRMHSPVRKEVVLLHDQPWEGNYAGYASIVTDGKLYRLYYRAGRYNIAARKAEHQVTCYAESRDGIQWTKPALGIHDFKGSAQNNIVWTGQGAHCFSAFLDGNPAAPPKERFKAFASDMLPSKDKPILALCSADGIHWRRWRAEPVIVQKGIDPSDQVLWDPNDRCYVAYLRGWRTHRGGTPVAIHVKWVNGVFRQVLRTTSRDFQSWSDPAFIDFGDTPLDHLYTFPALPYFRAPHLYLAFPMRFMPDRKAVPEHPRPGVSDSVLLSSRDGIRWDRTFLEAFLRPGRDRDNWRERNNVFVRGMVPTADDEISMYCLERFRTPTPRLRRCTLRLDGFASVYAPASGGEIVTHPLRFAGKELVLNYATSGAGTIQVEFRDERSRPIPGFALKDCPEIYGDEIEGVVRWHGKRDVSELTGRAVRLSFVLRDADVYSLRFQP